jgi:hypothetical protein
LEISRVAKFGGEEFGERAGIGDLMPICNA